MEFHIHELLASRFFEPLNSNKPTNISRSPESIDSRALDLSMFTASGSYTNWLQFFGEQPSLQ